MAPDRIRQQGRHEQALLDADVADGCNESDASVRSGGGGGGGESEVDSRASLEDDSGGEGAVPAPTPWELFFRVMTAKAQGRRNVLLEMCDHVADFAMDAADCPVEVDVARSLMAICWGTDVDVNAVAGECVALWINTVDGT